MNRRQEIVTWVFGLAACLALLANSDLGADWMIRVLAPLLIAGTLLFNRLRSEDPAGGERATTALGLLLVALPLLVLAHQVFAVSINLSSALGELAGALAHRPAAP